MMNLYGEVRFVALLRLFGERTGDCRSGQALLARQLPQLVRQLDDPILLLYLTLLLLRDHLAKVVHDFRVEVVVGLQGLEGRLRLV